MSNKYSDIRTGKVIYNTMIGMQLPAYNGHIHSGDSYRFYLPFNLIRCMWIYIYSSVKKIQVNKAVNDGIKINGIKVLSGYENKIVLAHRDALSIDGIPLIIKIDIPQFDSSEDITHEYLDNEGWKFFPASPIYESWYQKGKIIIEMDRNNEFYGRKGRIKKPLFFKSDLQDLN